LEFRGGGAYPHLESKTARLAFTLAEVLITLGIIGVVAAITMPVLINKHREAVIISQLKKTYSLLSQVVYELNYEYGGNWKDLTFVQLGDDITSRIKTLKVCKLGEGCFEQTPVTYLKGGSTGDWDILTNCYKFITADGVNILVEHSSGSPLLHYNKKPDFGITVDVNGTKKPNRLGRDIFIFAIRDGKLIYAGIDDESASCTEEMYGYTCAWRVLTEGKFNY